MKWLLLFLSLNCFSQEMNIERYNPTPNEATVSTWLDDLFRTNEFVVVGNRATYFSNLRIKYPEHFQIIDKMEARYRTNISKDELGALVSIQDQGSLSGGFDLDPKLRAQLPKELLDEINLGQINHSAAMPNITANSMDEMIANIDKWNISDEAKTNLKQQLVQHRGKTVLFFNNHNWNEVPEEIKRGVIEAYTKPKRGSVSRNALNIEVSFSNPEEIKALASQYGAAGDSAAIERYLLRLLEKNEGKAVRIKLEDILPPFIRKRMNQYDLVGGPNCFNSGLCVNQGNSYTTEYTNDVKLQNGLETDYMKLADDVPLQTGDLLLYSDEFGGPVHVATYINEDVVFTKNGITKFNPYIFQTRAEMEQVYGASRLVLTRHRIRQGARGLMSAGRLRASKIKDCLPVIMFN